MGCPRIRQSICPSVCPSVRQLICPSVRPFGSPDGGGRRATSGMTLDKLFQVVDSHGVGVRGERTRAGRTAHRIVSLPEAAVPPESRRGGDDRATVFPGWLHRDHELQPILAGVGGRCRSGKNSDSSRCSSRHAWRQPGNRSSQKTESEPSGRPHCGNSTFARNGWGSRLYFSQMVLREWESGCLRVVVLKLSWVDQQSLQGSRL